MLLTLLLSTANAAQAVTPLPAWNWPAGEVQRFHLESEIVTPTGQRYYAAQNIDARAGSVRLRADAGCTATPLGKARVVRCSFNYFSVTGKPWAADEEGKLTKIMEEWTADLSTTEVELEIGPDGRLRSLDMIGGKDRSNKREGYIIEQQRMLLQRLYCVFDLPLTTDEKDWVRGWDQKGGSAIMQLQTITGTTGAVDMKHTHKGERHGLAVIETVAKGTLSAGAAVDSTTGSRLVDMRMAGETLFDTSKGMFAWRDFTLDGRLMVSSQEAASGGEYFQATALQWVEAFPAPGEIPMSVAAMRAPRLDGVQPARPAEIPLVLFAELGMQPLFVKGMPEGAKSLDLPVTKVSARVQVAADGIPTNIKAFAGFAALGPATEQALQGARFPARGAPYVVDVELEWQPDEE